MWFQESFQFFLCSFRSVWTPYFVDWWRVPRPQSVFGGNLWMVYITFCFIIKATSVTKICRNFLTHLKAYLHLIETDLQLSINFWKVEKMKRKKELKRFNLRQLLSNGFSVTLWLTLALLLLLRFLLLAHFLISSSIPKCWEQPAVFWEESSLSPLLFSGFALLSKLGRPKSQWQGLETNSFPKTQWIREPSGTCYTCTFRDLFRLGRITQS